MFWLMEDKEPDSMRMFGEMEAIDKDGSGTIDLIEFISYLLSKRSSGFSYFDFELRKSFSKFDKDKDGRLEEPELVEFLFEFYTNELHFCNPDQKE